MSVHTRTKHQGFLVLGFKEPTAKSYDRQPVSRKQAFGAGACLPLVGRARVREHVSWRR